MSKTLINEAPLLIPRTLAKYLGLLDAIFLQQVHFWVEINKQAGRNLKKGDYWMYLSSEGWIEELPFLCEKTIKNIIVRLKKLNLLIVDHLDKNHFNRTNWFRVNYEELERLEVSWLEEKEEKARLKFFALAVKEVEEELEESMGSKIPDRLGKFTQCISEPNTQSERVTDAQSKQRVTEITKTTSSEEKDYPMDIEEEDKELREDFELVWGDFPKKDSHKEKHWLRYKQLKPKIKLVKLALDLLEEQTNGQVKFYPNFDNFLTSFVAKKTSSDDYDPKTGIL